MAEIKIQFSLTFIPIEDRLLFKIASGTPGVAMEECQLWLTRRLVKILWNALEHMLDLSTSVDPQMSPEWKSAIKQFHQSAALLNTDFSTHYASEKLNTYPGTNPLLIHKFQAREGADGNQIISLEATTGQTVNVTLNLQLIHSFFKLLSDIIKEAEWDIHPCAVISEDAVYIADAPKTIN
jgi:hypothetical protein